MKMYDGFIESMKNDNIYIPKLNNKRLNEAVQDMNDLVPGFPVNKEIPYNEALMIKAIQNGMIILIRYRGADDKWKGFRERVIQPMNLGKNKNTKNILLRAWHIDGYSVSEKKNVQKVWRLFNINNIKGMMFTGNFFRLPPKGYKMNDRIMTERTIAKADFNTIRRNQETLLRAGKIESEEKTSISTKDSIISTIHIKNTGTMLDLNKPWDNELVGKLKNKPDAVKISILKTIFSNSYIAVFGAIGEKNKTVKVYEVQDKGNPTLLGSYKTVESFLGKDFNKYKRVQNISEYDLFEFVKKI
ncbi:hypothetical protein M0Q50_02580 [bacterium]|jgi:hypothetical protein|nr:hypothetical protein [bacterium]